MGFLVFRLMPDFHQLVQESLIATRHVEGVAVISLRDSLCKYSTPNFVLSIENSMNCVDAFNNPPQVREDGFEIQGNNNDLFRSF